MHFNREAFIKRGQCHVELLRCQTPHEMFEFRYCLQIKTSIVGISLWLWRVAVAIMIQLSLPLHESLYLSVCPAIVIVTSSCESQLAIVIRTCSYIDHHRTFGAIISFTVGNFLKFLGPRGPLRTPSFVRPSVRSSVRSSRAKNLNHLQSLINHPRIMPDPSYEILA